MMFAESCYRQVADENEVARIFFKGSREMAGGVFGEAAEESGVGVGDALGGLDKALPVGVLADGEEDLTHSPCDARPVHHIPQPLTSAGSPRRSGKMAIASGTSRPPSRSISTASMPQEDAPRMSETGSLPTCRTRSGETPATRNASLKMPSAGFSEPTLAEATTPLK